MENRPTIELILPESQAKVVIYQYISSGQYKELQRMLIVGAKMDISGVSDNAEENNNLLKQSLKDTPATIAFDQQDMLATFLVKEVHTAEGTKIEDTKKYLYDLTITDGDALSEKLNEIEKNSNHSLQSKKK